MPFGVYVGAYFAFDEDSKLIDVAIRKKYACSVNELKAEIISPLQATTQGLPHLRNPKESVRISS